MIYTHILSLRFEKIVRFTARLFFCAMALLLLCGGQPANGQSKNELSLHGGGGLFTLRYTLPYGQYESGFGGEVGLGYTRFVSRSVGVGTGLSLSSYSAAARLDGAAILLPNLQDADGDRYDLRTVLLSYREQQQATFIHIPLMLNFQSGQHPFYAQVGVRLSIPLSARYESRNADLYSEGYYPALENTMQGPSYMGFGRFDGRSAAGTLDLKPVFAAAAEAGVKWKLSGGRLLYAGLFIDYGLTEALRSPHSESMMRPNAAAPENFTTGSVLASRYTSDNRAIDKLSLTSAGLRLRIAFGSPKEAAQKPKAAAQQPKEATQEPKAAAQTQQQEAAQKQQEAAQKRKEAAAQKRKAAAQKRKAAAQKRKEAAQKRKEAARKQKEAARNRKEAAQRRKEAAQTQRLKAAAARAQQQREANEAQRQKFEEQRRKVTDIRRRQAVAGREEERVITNKIIERPVANYSAMQTELTPNQKLDIAKKAILLKQNPSIKVICVGYTCDIGSDEENYRVSRERARMTKDFLVQQGVDASRISVLGEGRRNPLVPNTSEKNRRVNRRVEMVIVEE